MSDSRPYAVFDLDGTLIRWQLFHSIVDRLAYKGNISSQDYAKVLKTRENWQKRLNINAFSSYEAAIVWAYEKAIKDLTPKQFEDISRDVFNKHKDMVYVYTRSLMEELKAKNYMLFAISGSFDEVVKMIAGYYGFDDSAGSKHIVDSKGFTGEIDVIIQNRKVDKIREFEKKYALSNKNSIAIGDSMGDLALLNYVDNPIIFNPTKDLFVEAKKNAWDIVIERKNTIYKLKSKNGEYILSD